MRIAAFVVFLAAVAAGTFLILASFGVTGQDCRETTTVGTVCY